MKIALVNTIRPHAGSGDGITEIAYRLYEAFRKKHKVDLIYPIGRSKRNDVAGLAYANTIFKIKIRKMLAKDYDIVHIVNEEMGYVAKMVKDSGSDAKVITSVFSLMRLGKGYNKGMIQKAYSGVVAKGLRDAVKYSDMMAYSGMEIQETAEKLLGKPNAVRQIYIGPPHDSFLKASLPKKRKHKETIIGYVGAIALRKNPIFILKTAELMKHEKEYRFMVYGSGSELETLKKYKQEKGLDNVSLMGFAPENKLMEIYDSFDIFFYPSIEEGSSLPVFDAFARGLPAVLYSKTQMAREVKVHGIFAHNEKDAAKVIRDLRKHGYSDKKRNECRKYVSRFTWDRAIKEVFSAYKELLHE